MTKVDKLIERILRKGNVSYQEAEKILIRLGFEVECKGGSHHVFRKKGYPKSISLKKNRQLLNYQLELIKEAIDFYEA